MLIIRYGNTHKSTISKCSLFSYLLSRNCEKDIITVDSISFVKRINGNVGIFASTNLPDEICMSSRLAIGGGQLVAPIFTAADKKANRVSWRPPNASIFLKNCLGFRLPASVKNNVVQLYYLTGGYFFSLASGREDD